MSSTLDIQQLLPIKEELDEWSPDMEQQVQLLSIKKEEEEEADITDFPLAAAAAVKSENEEKVHSLLHHVKNEYKDEEEPQTSSSGVHHVFDIKEEVSHEWSPSANEQDSDFFQEEEQERCIGQDGLQEDDTRATAPRTFPMPIFSVASRNAFQRLKLEQREKIQFCVQTRISVKKTFKMLQEVYGSKAMSRSRCKDWYLRFKNGRTSVDDETRSGRPSTSTTPKHIREIDRLVHQDLRISVREISAILNVSFGTVQAILTSTLNLHQVANKFVPRLLTPELKQNRLQTCKDLCQQTRDDPTFMSRIITGDESWVYGCKPGKARKVNPTRSKIKVKLIVFFDIHGVVHREFVPDGQAVDAPFYLNVMTRLRKNIEAKRPELWQKGDWLLHHDDTPAHNALKECHYFCYTDTNLILHPQHSPDLAPCDFFLFPKINAKLRGHFFDTVEEFQHASLIVLDSLGEEDFHRAFTAWQQRWVWCAAVQGNYLAANGGQI
ncbi:unnamed protein product [Oreochromis niloticus]|nr:unnamed protein product [Mustela putorius furo]